MTPSSRTIVSSIMLISALFLIVKSSTALAVTCCMEVIVLFLVFLELCHHGGHFSYMPRQLKKLKTGLKF